MGEFIRRNWDFREFRVWVNLPSPIRQVRVPILYVKTPIWGLVNPIRQVVPLISEVRLYPLYRSHLHRPSLSFLSTTLPSLQVHKVKSSLSISPCHHHEFTWNAAYTKCSIHWVQYTPSTAHTYDCLLSLHSLDFELTTECSFSFQHTFLQIACHQPVLHQRFQGKVTSSHSHGFELTNRWIQCQHLARLPSTVSRSSTPRISLNYSLLQVHLSTRSITARSASLSSLNHSLK